MVLPMCRPFKHPETHVYYFRKAVPSDLRAALGKGEVKLSLRTKSPAEARERFAKVEAEVAAEWKRLRTEPDGLTKRDALALAGAWYRWFTAQHEDEPGEEDGWMLLGGQLDDFDRQASGLHDERDVEWREYVRSAHTEARVTAYLASTGRTDEFLRGAGVHLSPDGHKSFYAALEPQFRAAMRLLVKRSGNDHSADRHPATMPEWRAPKPPALTYP